MARRPPALLLLLTLSVFGIAPASAQDFGVDAEMIIAVGPGRAEAELLASMTGEAARGMRRGMDMDGNGRVDEGEARLLGGSRTFTVRDDANTRACFRNSAWVFIGGQRVERMESFTMRMVGLEGAVNTTKPVSQSLHMAFIVGAVTKDPKVELNFGAMDQVEDAMACAMGFSNFAQAWSGWDQYDAADGAAATTSPGSSSGSGSTSGFELPARLRIRALAGSQILNATIQPAEMRRWWTGSEIVADSASELAFLDGRKVTFQMVGGASGSTSDPWPWVFGIGGGIVALGLSTTVTEFGRYKFLKGLAAFGLFTRLDKDEVLEHDTREQLYQFIQKNPGPSFSDLRRELGISNGTLVHHLRILESQEFIKPFRDGFRTRFYVRGPRIVPTTYLTRTQQTILEAIQGNPGITQKELAGLLGLPRESVFYHARKLESAGSIQVAREGKWRKYFPTAGAAAAGASAATGPTV